MKKTYINPEMEIIKLQSQQQMLAGSAKAISDETPGEWGAHEEDDFDWSE